MATEHSSIQKLIVRLLLGVILITIWGSKGYAQTASFTNDDPVCGNTQLHFYGSMGAANANDYTFFWEFGDGKTANTKDALHDFLVSPGQTAATFTVKLTATRISDAYEFIATKTITVSPKPSAELEDANFPLDPFNNCIYNPTPQNPTFLITIKNTSTNTDYIASYLIDWGDTSPTESFLKNQFPATRSHTYTRLGLFKLSLTTTGDNGCTNTKIYNVKNQSNPGLGLSTPGNTEGCAPVTFTFKLSDIGNNDSETSYLIDYGDGQTQTLTQTEVLLLGNDISHEYSKSSCDQPDKAYTIKVKAYNSCSYTLVTAGGIKITSQPIPSFTASNLCLHQPIQFDNFTISDCSNNVSYTWDFGDGTTKNTTDVTSFTHTYLTDNDTYTVTLNVHSSCQDKTITKVITLTKPPVADFELNPSGGCLNTTNPLVIHATNKTTGEVTNLLWSITPATGWTAPIGFSSLPNPQFTFTKKGNYTISLIASNNCSSSEKRIKLTVGDLVYATLVPSITSPTCESYTFDATNTNIFNIDSIQYENVRGSWHITPATGWSYVSPDTQNTLAPKIAFTAPGTYTISVDLTNGCGTITKTTTLLIKELARVSSTPSATTGCAPTQISFSDHSTGTNLAHLWTVSPSSYSFINSTTATSKEPSIQFNSAGIYTVTHRVTGDCNQVSQSYTITISAAPIITFQDISNQCPPLPFDLIINSSNFQLNNNGVPLTSITWSVTPSTGVTYLDGTTETSTYPHIHFTQTGQYDVKVIVVNDCGTSTMTKTFRILIPAVESATPSVTNGCLPLTVNFANQSTGDLLTHSWTVSPATNWTMTGAPTDASPSIKFNKIGVYTVTHKITNQCGSDQHDYIITVKDKPTAVLAPFTNHCDSFTFNGDMQNFNVTLNQNDPSEVSYLWTVTPSQGTSFINGTNLNSQYPSIQISDTGVFVIKAALTNACGNSEVQQPISITKSPQIALTDNLNKNCLPSDLSFSGNVYGQHLTYQWSVLPNSGVSYQGSTTANSSRPQIRFTQPGSYEVTLTVSNNCGTDVHKWTEDIIGNPTILFTQIPNTCDNYTFKAEDFVTVEDNRNAIKNYNWTISPSTGFQYQDLTNASSEFPHILFIDAGTYTLTMTATNDCGVSSPATRSFTVDKFIQVTVEPNSKTCAGPDLIKLTGNPAGGNWSILPSSASSQLKIIGSNTYFDPSLPGEYTFTYKRGSSYCNSEASNKITVIALPVVNAGSDFSICSNETTPHALVGSPAGGTWSGTGVTGSNFSTTGLAVGPYILKYSYTDPVTNCINTDQLIAHVLEVPITSFNAPQGCKDTPLTFTPLGTAGTHYSWDFGDGQTGTSTGPIDHTYHLGGEYTVTLGSSDPNNCALTSSKIIKVQDERATFTTSGQCIPVSATFTDHSIGDNLTHSWTVSPATDYTITPFSTSASPTITFNTAGLYTVTHTTTTTCGSDHHDYIIKVKDAPTATIAPFSDACNSYTFNADASNFQVDPKQNDNVTYLWSVTPSSAVTFLNSTGNTEKYPIIQIADTGVFIIKVKLTGECGSTETQKPINITRKPVIALSQVFNHPCIPSDLTFTGTVYGQKLNYQWTVVPNTGVSFQDPTSSTSPRPQIRFTQPGRYKVLLKVSNYCDADNVEWNDTIKSVPTINFNAIPDTCDNYMLKTEKFVTFNNNDSPITQYSWSVIPNVGFRFMDGTSNTSAFPHILFTTEGAYQVSVNATNECGSTTNGHSFTVDKFIQVTVGQDSTFCTNPDLIKLTGIPSGGYWKILPTSASSLLKVNSNITYFDPSLPGVYTLTYHRGNSYCFSEASKKFTVVALPVVDAGRDFNICSNETKPFTLNGTPIGGTWSGTGIKGNTFSPIGIPVGNYILKYTYTDPNTLCLNTDQLIAHVLDVPVTGFDVQIQGCKDQLITYTPFGPANTTFNWDFGDGTTGTSTGQITHIYHIGDTYTVNMVSADQNSCAYNSSKKISIQGDIKMPAISYIPTNGCGPLTVSFKIDTTGTTSNGQKHYWDFGNGIVGNDAITSKDITYEPGISDTSYTVHFTITNNCFTKTVDYIIPVRSKPNSNFSFPHPYECSPASVHFKNQTVDRSAKFYWDFDDGTTSAEYEPTHIFTTGKIAKDFKIKLVSTNGCGKDSIIKSLLIKPNSIEVFIKMSARQACPRDVVYFTNLSSDTVSRISSYYWDFGDGTIVHSWDASHAYAASGKYTVKLYVDNGCSRGEMTDQIEILQVPKLQITSLDSICKLDTLKLEGSSNGVVLINGKWDFGDGTSGTGLKLSHVYTTIGWHTITFLAADATSILQCDGLITKRVYVKEVPYLPSFPDLAGCSPFSISIPSPGTDAYLWNFGDDIIWTSSSNHTYINNGTLPVRKKVTVIAENNNICRTTSFFWVTIYPNPVAKIGVRSEGGYPETVYFKNLSTNSATCEWKFPDGSIGMSCDSIVYHFYRNGTSRIYLKTSNQYGCTDTTSILHESLIKGLFVPNALQPSNLDPLVKIFKPIGIGLKTYHLGIYDIWGNIIWETEKITDTETVEGWDGKTKSGKELPQGVYVWRITATFIDGTSWKGMKQADNKTRTEGTITLIR